MSGFFTPGNRGFQCIAGYTPPAVPHKVGRCNKLSIVRAFKQGAVVLRLPSARPATKKGLHKAGNNSANKSVRFFYTLGAFLAVLFVLNRNTMKYKQIY